jgi:hypothetical protein
MNMVGSTRLPVARRFHGMVPNGGTPSSVDGHGLENE